MVLGGQSTPSIGPMSPPAVLADCVVSGGSVTLVSLTALYRRRGWLSTYLTMAHLEAQWRGGGETGGTGTDGDGSRGLPPCCVSHELMGAAGLPARHLLLLSPPFGGGGTNQAR
jgi:hypothetical protein